MTRRARDLVYEFGAEAETDPPHIHIGRHVGAPELNVFLLKKQQPMKLRQSIMNLKKYLNLSLKIQKKKIERIFIMKISYKYFIKYGCYECTL